VFFCTSALYDDEKSFSGFTTAERAFLCFVYCRKLLHTAGLFRTVEALHINRFENFKND
jgi:hypothetical protein